MDLNPICSNCHLPVLSDFYFCPNCGKNLRPKPMSVTIGKQVGLYLLSLFLPPLGLWPGFKYLFQKDIKAKMVGLTAIILTFISFVAAYYLTLGLIDQLKNQLNIQLGNQINGQINGQLQQDNSSLEQLAQ